MQRHAAAHILQNMMKPIFLTRKAVEHGLLRKRHSQGRHVVAVRTHKEGIRMPIRGRYDAYCV
ncbi:hypothetical protein DPMN_176343 [Dreissena polymorpha]|uniref:Uncharacterized protein n=1 Tax=Dreissena polymorpha TaxID=45954 RepID=A0A9D4IKH5_DREPO|nr:hypothetical protein DPMN_176343 [Dreissena polymorpha]